MAIHDVRGWEDIEQHARVRYLNRAADLQDAIHIVVADLAIGIGDGNLAAGVLSKHVTPGDGDRGVLNVIPGETFGSIDGCTNCGASLLDVGDNTLTHPLVWVRPLTNDADGSVLTTDVRDRTRHL